MEASDVVTARIWQRPPRPQKALISNPASPVSRQTFQGHLQTLWALGGRGAAVLVSCPLPFSDTYYSGSVFSGAMTGCDQGDIFGVPEFTEQIT